MLDPIFFAPTREIFFVKCSNFLDPIRGRQFFVKSAHRDSLCARSQETIFLEIYSGLPVSAGWNTCCAVVRDARRTIGTSIVSQSRVQLIHCQCMTWLQIANQGINNTSLIESSLFDHAVYIRHQTVPRQIKSAWLVDIPLLWHLMHTMIRRYSWCKTV